MAPYSLIIGNKNYSSWSLRPWLMMTACDIPFEETVIALDTPNTRQEILRHSPSGRVPVLKDGELTVWDSLSGRRIRLPARGPGRFPPKCIPASAPFGRTCR